MAFDAPLITVDLKTMNAAMFAPVPRGLEIASLNQLESEIGLKGAEPTLATGGAPTC